MLQSRLLPDRVCKQSAKLTMAAYHRSSANHISNYLLLWGLPHRSKLVWEKNKEKSTGYRYNYPKFQPKKRITENWRFGHSLWPSSCFLSVCVISDEGHRLWLKRQFSVILFWVGIWDNCTYIPLCPNREFLFAKSTGYNFDTSTIFNPDSI